MILFAAVPKALMRTGEANLRPDRCPTASDCYTSDCGVEIGAVDKSFDVFGGSMNEALGIASTVDDCGEWIVEWPDEWTDE